MSYETLDTASMSAYIRAVDALSSVTMEDANAVSRQQDTLKKQLLRNLGQEISEEFLRTGNISLLDPAQAERYQRKLKDEETAVAIKVREAKERAEEITLLNKRYDEVQQEAREGEVIVGEIIEVFSTTTEASFTQQISEDPEAATSLMQKIDKAYSPVPKQANLAKDLTAQLQKEGQTTEQKDQLKAQRKDIQDSLRKVDLGNAGAVGMMSKKVDELQPDIHGKQKSAGSEFAVAACNMINLGRVLKGKPELSFNDYQAELAKEKASGRKFSKLGNEAMMSARHFAREMGVTESNSHCASLQEFIAAHPELCQKAQKKLEELSNKERNKTESAVTNSNNNKVTPADLLQTNPSAPIPISAISSELNPEVVFDPNAKKPEPKELNLDNFFAHRINSDGKFESINIEAKITTDGKVEYAVASMVADSSGKPVFNTTKVSSDKAAELKAAAQQFLASGAKLENTNPSAKPAESATKTAEQAATEAAKPMTDSQVSAPKPAAEGTKAAPTPPKPAGDKPAEVAIAR